MTGSTKSNLLTLVKPWSTWVITSKTSSIIPNDPLEYYETFVVFSKIHLNTPKYPNIKVVQFFERHNFAFGWHFKSGVESGETLSQLQILLFISAMKN
jgi:hypothetical protein